MKASVEGHRVLVTGGTGFVGSWLTEYLYQHGAIVTVVLADWNVDSHYVRSAAYRHVKQVPGSITDYAFLERVIREHGIDTVMHTAAVSVEGLAYRDPLLAFKVNIEGTWNVLEACRKNADLVKRVIIASSDKAYGDHKGLPYTEDMALRGEHPYDVSKSCADLIAQAYQHTYKLPVAIGRFGNIYGGGDLNYSRLVPNSIRRMLCGKGALLKTPPNGAFMRDFLYVKDCVQAYIAMFEGLERPEVHGQGFNFAIGGTWKIDDVVGTMQDIMGTRHLEPEVLPAAHSEILHQHVSPVKAGKLLHWSAAYGLEEGLRETVEWYKAFYRDRPELLRSA